MISIFFKVFTCNSSSNNKSFCLLQIVSLKEHHLLANQSKKAIFFFRKLDFLTLDPLSKRCQNRESKTLPGPPSLPPSLPQYHYISLSLRYFEVISRFPSSQMQKTIMHELLLVLFDFSESTKFLRFRILGLTDYQCIIFWKIFLLIQMGCYTWEKRFLARPHLSHLRINVLQIYSFLFYITFLSNAIEVV